MREGILTQLTTAHNYFSMEGKLFDELEMRIGKKEGIENFRNSNYLLSFLGIIGFFVYCWKCFMPIANWFTEESPVINSIFEKIGTVLPSLLVIILWVISMLVFFIIVYFIGAVVVSMFFLNIKIMITEPSYKRQIAHINTKIEEITLVYNSYENTIGEKCPIPFDRCTPSSIVEIIDVVSSSRADSVKEAINIILQDEYNNEMKKLGEQQVDSLNQANIHLKKISKNTRRIAWNTFWR